MGDDVFNKVKEQGDTAAGSINQAIKDTDHYIKDNTVEFDPNKYIDKSFNPATNPDQQKKQNIQGSILDRWEQTGGGYLDPKALDDYTNGIFAGQGELSDADLNYYRDQNKAKFTPEQSKTQQDILASWDRLGGGYFNGSDLASYTDRIISGEAQLSDTDLINYRNGMNPVAQPQQPQQPQHHSTHSHNNHNSHKHHLQYIHKNKLINVMPKILLWIYGSNQAVVILRQVT